MQIPSEIEGDFLRNSILLPLLLIVLERDKKVISTSLLKTKEPYLTLIEKAILKVERDIVNNNKSLRLYGLKVYEQKRTQQGIAIKFLYKGYHHEFKPSWNVLRNLVKEKMVNYLREG